MASRLPMVANLAISNVPGAPMPLYLAGAEFLSFHPLSIIMHGLALNITIQTYAGHVDFGIIADKKALPHANDFARAIQAAFDEAKALLALAAPAPATAAAAPVKTRKALVPQVTKAAKLEKSPSVQRVRRPDTVFDFTTSKKSNASSHGKPVVKTVKKPVKKRVASR